MLNSLIRVSEDPLELNYIQLPFQDIFKVVQHLYRKQTDYLKQFGEVYRGCELSPNDIKKFKSMKKGEVIELLGFISTSKDKGTGQFFIRNAFIIIELPTEKRDPEMDFGYANISKLSSF